MNCPICNSDKLICTDSRPSRGNTRRRKECQMCAHRFTTLEISADEYKTLKYKEMFLEDVLKRVGDIDKLKGVYTSE